MLINVPKSLLNHVEQKCASIGHLLFSKNDPLGENLARVCRGWDLGYSGEAFGKHLEAIWWDLGSGEIWWDLMRSGKISWDLMNLVRSGEISWDLEGSDGMWWDLVRCGQTWWDLMRSGEIWAENNTSSAWTWVRDNAFLVQTMRKICWKRLGMAAKSSQYYSERFPRLGSCGISPLQCWEWSMSAHNFPIFPKVLHPNIEGATGSNHYNIYMYMYFWIIQSRVGSVNAWYFLYDQVFKFLTVHQVVVRSGEIWWDVVRSGEIWWRLVRSGEIWLHLVTSGDIWWDLIRHDGIWWDLMSSGERQAAITTTITHPRSTNQCLSV